VDAEQQQEQGDEEGWQTETTLNEIPRAPSAQATTGVHEFMVLVQDLTLLRILNHALVCGTRREIRYECQTQEYGQTDNQDAENEVQSLIMEYLVYIQHFRQAGVLLLSGFVFFLFLCHIDVTFAILMQK
jgi:hypothetical protein